MKVFIVLCALFAINCASPAGLTTFYTAEAPITQYHSQDELGTAAQFSQIATVC